MSNNSDSCKVKCALICNDSGIPTRKIPIKHVKMSLKRMLKYLPRQWDTHSFTVKPSNNIAQTAAQAGKGEMLFAGKGLRQIQRLADVIPHFPKSKQLFTAVLKVCPTLPPQDGSTRVPQVRWCPAPGSCAAPKNTHSSANTHTHTNKPQRRCETWSPVHMHAYLPWNARSLELHFPFDGAFKGQHPSENHVSIYVRLLWSKVSYLSYNVSILGVHLGDGSQIADHTEHLVHLRRRGRHSDGLWCTNAAFFPLSTNCESCSLLHVNDTVFPSFLSCLVSVMHKMFFSAN